MSFPMNFTIVLVSLILVYSPGERKVYLKSDLIMETIKVTSSAFSNNAMIPSKYTCDGINISPSIEWQGIPEGTKSIALICDDPDAPIGDWVHWILFNIPPSVRSIKEGFTYRNKPAPEILAGRTDFGKLEYGGPCPPSGTHRYFFKIYAVDTMLKLSEGSTKKQLLQAVEGHILGKGELMGTYNRKR